ncbi:nucleotide-binding universal stress UspA family protein [Ulvibacter sp. MAR_2010_11]|uniref:universal stress protein n=1 Tax=Ulvibacter sp. MAR_2010_11 TaxID=1250229 RepID=UPI000C2C996A|nr:universal stress protein [Ulvibacter sp. MAR_2010_11]PKA84482.1 nucleotide-binding universal stress UspA family protein [Ulvibacter sp. MAR_2010_11]
MKNILLPTDFSANSLNAIDYAMRFFANWTCNFYILNVQKVSEYISDDLISGSKTDTIYDSIVTDNKRLIIQLVKKLSKQYKSQSYTFHGLFDYDDFVSAVDQAVKFHSIDLIIMGTNGATGAKEVIFGSNTLQIVRNIACPTITIPENYTYTNIKSTLFSTKYCEDFSFEGIKIFKEMLNMHQCELNVLEIDDDAIITSVKEDNECLRALFTEYPYTYYRLQTIPGLIAVNTATQLLKVDLHAVFIEKETFLERLMFGSDSSQLVYRTLIPLLFLHR